MFEPKNTHREMPQAKLLQLLQLHNCPNNHCNSRRLQPLHILGIIYIYTHIYIYILACVLSDASKNIGMEFTIVAGCFFVHFRPRGEGYY